MNTSITFSQQVARLTETEIDEIESAQPSSADGWDIGKLMGVLNRLGFPVDDRLEAIRIGCRILAERQFPTEL